MLVRTEQEFNLDSLNWKALSLDNAAFTLKVNPTLTQSDVDALCALLTDTATQIREMTAESLETLNKTKKQRFFCRK